MYYLCGVIKPEDMTKFVYSYVDRDLNGFVVESLVQLSGLTDMNYRTLQRRMKDGFYMHPQGKFTIFKLEYRRDGRTKNGDPDIKDKYKN
jgi:hypothetical protein